MAHDARERSNRQQRLVGTGRRRSRLNLKALLRHGTDAEIEANYTDTHGVVVTWTPLVPLAPLVHRM